MDRRRVFGDMVDAFFITARGVCCCCCAEAVDVLKAAQVAALSRG